MRYFNHQNTGSSSGHLDVRKPTWNELLVTVFNNIMGLTVDTVSLGNKVRWAQEQIIDQITLSQNYPFLFLELKEKKIQLSWF